MKILYVSQYFPPEMGAPAARAAELSRLWVNDGHDVTVLTGFPNHPTGVVPRDYRKKIRNMIHREQVNGINVIRTWLWPLPNRCGWQRILNYTSFFVSAAATGTFLQEFDVVIGTSPQLLVGLSAWWIARCQRVPFIFEVRDLWPESLVAVGAGNAQSILHRTLSRVAGFLYRESHRIVVVTRAFKTHLVNHWNIPPEKILVIENGVDTRLFHPHAAGPETRDDLALQEKFVVSYIGTMGMAHGLETLLDTAFLLQSRAPQVQFLLIGEGAEKHHLQSLAVSQNLTNIRFLDQRPRDRVPAYICASDACLVMLKKADLFKTVLPTKLLEFMSCARPVILAVDGESRRIVEDARAGIFVEPQNPPALAGAILHLSENPQLCNELGTNGRHYITRHFAREHTASRYVELLEEICEGKAEREAAAAA
ncbi:MAG TPA: glycosyltransferase family 4 protein [Terriglobales bacterium]